MDDPYLLPITSSKKFTISARAFYKGAVENCEKNEIQILGKIEVEETPCGKLQLYLDERTRSPTNFKMSESAKNSPLQQTSLLTFFPNNSGKKISPKRAFLSETTQPTRKLRKKLLTDNSDDQYLIDVGQKALGASQCPTCQMFFSPIQPSDVAEHKRYHDRFVSVLKFPKKGWKTVPTTNEFPDGTIYQIRNDSAKFAIKKVSEVCEVVDRDLGFPDGSEVWSHTRQAFLFVSSPFSGSESKVIGCCIAEQLKEACAMLEDGCCEEKSRKALVGVNRIWVSSDHRGKKIASRLLDAVRFHFFLGCPVDKELLAFSDPTKMGLTLATSYCGTTNILVYKPI